MTEAPYTNVALFGATGYVGQKLLEGLLNPSTEGYKPQVKVFLRKESNAESIPNHERVEKVVADLNDVDDLAEKLKGIDAVVSALNGPGVDAQYKVLDAAAKAGVRRFLPSEYGSEHPWRKPGDSWTHTHPYFDVKARFKEYMYLHPAMMSGKITYTIVGTGDLYDQPTENYWIAWAQEKLPDRYVFPIVGDPNSQYELTKLTDLAQYVAALLARPSTSKDSHLNFVSDIVSQQDIADMLQSASGRPVEPDYVSEEQAHEYIANPDKIPERAKETRFDPVFWYIVRLQQGTNKFRRHPSLIHNDLYPEVKPTLFQEYLANEVGRKAMKEV
ncbi:hypothetical protein JCM6882_005275 [Rhodosporidiobolus microsporus]